MNKKSIIFIVVIFVVCLALPALFFLIKNDLLNTNNLIPQPTKSEHVSSKPPTLSYAPFPNSPKATGPETSISLVASPVSVKVGQIVNVQVLIRSDQQASNLFSVKFNYPKNLLQFEKIDTTNSLVKDNLWVDEKDDPTNQRVSIIGGVPNPGYQTKYGDTSGYYATVSFKALAPGIANLQVLKASQIFSNSKNINILNAARGTTVTVSQ